MKQIGVLFQSDMVRAILEDRKTLTSRLRGLEDQNKRPSSWDYVGLNNEGDHLFRRGYSLPFTYACPFGQPGDVLIGRETWRVGAWSIEKRAIAVDYRADNFARQKWLSVPEDQFVRLWDQSCLDAKKAGLQTPNGKYEWRPGQSPCRWRPSILMPWWASRLRLEVVKVWPSRLQDMTDEMAVQEGIEMCEGCGGSGVVMNWDDHTTSSSIWPPDNEKPCEKCSGSRPLAIYAQLWDRINGKTYPWASNPWVWRVQFKRITS